MIAYHPGVAATFRRSSRRHQPARDTSTSARQAQWVWRNWRIVYGGKRFTTPALAFELTIGPRGSRASAKACTSSIQRGRWRQGHECVIQGYNWRTARSSGNPYLLRVIFPFARVGIIRQGLAVAASINLRGAWGCYFGFTFAEIMSGRVA